jgi:hypothetical protein
MKPKYVKDLFTLHLSRRSRGVVLDETALIDDSARVAKATIEKGTTTGRDQFHLNALLVGNILTQDRQGTTSHKKRKGCEAIEAAVGVSNVGSSLLEGKARTAIDVDADSRIVAAATGALGKFFMSSSAHCRFLPDALVVTLEFVRPKSQVEN